MSQPQQIVLDSKNSVELLSQYIDVAQSKGAFTLQESDILKRARDLLLKNVQDPEINVPTARNLFVQAIQKGQSKGAYSLDDASILHKICQYVSQNLAAENVAESTLSTNASSVKGSTTDNDLNSLSESVPLKSSPRSV